MIHMIQELFGQTLRDRPALSDALKGLREQACGSTSFIFAVCKSVATIAQVRPPPADPASNAFFRVIVCGRMARSTMLESISARPSLRKRSRAARRERA